MMAPCSTGKKISKAFFKKSVGDVKRFLTISSYIVYGPKMMEECRQQQYAAWFNSSSVAYLAQSTGISRVTLAWSSAKEVAYPYTALR